MGANGEVVVAYGMADAMVGVGFRFSLFLASGLVVLRVTKFF